VTIINENAPRRTIPAFSIAATVTRGIQTTPEGVLAPRRHIKEEATY
jgi:hypothetical protein